MADSGEELRREYEEFEQSESSLDSGLESAPARAGMAPWIKWVIVIDVVIVAALLIVFAR